MWFMAGTEFLSLSASAASSRRTQNHCASHTSIADCGPGRPSRVVDPEEAAIGADRDQLDRAPRVLFHRLVAARGQCLYDLRPQPAALVIERIRQPLVMKSRGGDGVGRL